MGWVGLANLVPLLGGGSQERIIYNSWKGEWEWVKLQIEEGNKQRYGEGDPRQDLSRVESPDCLCSKKN